MNKKEKVLAFMNTDTYFPLKEEELVLMLDVPKDSIHELKLILAELEAEGLIRKTKRGRYICIKENDDIVVGNIMISSRGFGFVVTQNSEKGENDIYIGANSLNGAIDGDNVMARLIRSKATQGHRRTGEVIKILKRARTTISGELVKGKSNYILSCDDKHIPNKVVVSDINNAAAGDRVIAAITKYPSAKSSVITVAIESVLGDADDISTHIQAILHEYKIREEFDYITMQEADLVSKTISPADLEGRADFRDECIFTIDGDDAKDLDDSVSVKRIADGYELGVHIADVSHYVKAGSALDKEAFLRATSIYFPGHVIPMLPKALSNGICSLHPNEDRLTFSVIMKIDNTGNVFQYNITPSVIRSKYRMTYNAVAAILDGDIILRNKYSSLCANLELLRELALILIQKRKNRGSIDFDIPEAYISVDKQSMPVEIEKRPRNIAHRIIEECMLICNETVAEHAFWTDMPFVYRIHETPTAEKMKDFADFIYNFNIRLKGKKDDMHPKNLQNVLESIKGELCERAVSSYMLRSLMKAKYSPNNNGHFGLAAKYYCHFTSPIRRYPDLVIHRLLKQNISKENIDIYKAFTEKAALQSTDMEITAMKIERDVTDLMKTVYMSGKEGECFVGIISSVIEFGFFVELENTVEGFVRLESIKDDYYSLDTDKKCIIGKRKHKTFSIGDVVKVKLVKADVNARQIDFILKKD